VQRTKHKGEFISHCGILWNCRIYA